MNIFSNISKKEKLGLAVAVLIVLFAFLDRLIVAPIGLKFKRINSDLQAVINFNVGFDFRSIYYIIYDPELSEPLQSLKTFKFTK